MKSIPSLTLAAALLPSSLRAPPTIDWQGAHGGGTGAGGPWSIAGTIGQPVAGGAMSGGNFAVTGGFWSPTVATRTTPRIARNGDGTLSVLWPSYLTGFLVEESPDLTMGSWVPTSYPVTDNGSVRSITFTPAGARGFYRLTD